MNKDLDYFNTIYSKAEQVAEEKKYNPIYFYEIIFCYLHYYDKVNFAKKTEKLSEGNADNLYEILIQYYSHFMYPLNQSKKFYNNFRRYIIKKDKDLKIFMLVLDYIEDIETYLFVINNNKEQLFTN